MYHLHACDSQKYKMSKTYKQYRDIIATCIAILYIASAGTIFTNTQH